MRPMPVRGPAAASFAARMEWFAWFQALHPPSDPLAHAAAHDRFQVVAFEPWHLFGEHGDALAVCTREPRQVGPPETAPWAEGVATAADGRMHPTEQRGRSV